MAELPQYEISYIIIIGTIGMLCLTVGFAIFVTVYQRKMLEEHDKRRKLELEYQQKMIQAQIDSQEAERKRIAADLHDNIGSMLWAVKLNIGFLGRMVSLDGELRKSYNETMTMLDQSISSVKRISWELTPEAFQHSGLSSSVRELCTRMNGKDPDVIFMESGQPLFWNDERALMVYRIVQELINNALRHSRCTELTVHVHWLQQSLRVEVKDNGIGFTLGENSKRGVGWWNITHRAAKIGAQLHHNEQAKRGTSITVMVSLKHE